MATHVPLTPRAARHGATADVGGGLARERASRRELSRVVRYAIERKRSQLALRDSEERFRRLAENAPDIIYRYDLQPQRGLSYVSPAVTDVLGYAPAELYDPAFKTGAVVDPADYARLKNLLALRVGPRPVTVRMRHREGHVVWTEHRCVPIYDAAGTVVAIEGIVRDMTERRQMEMQLTRADKLHSLGVMAGGMVHQMNNMLTSVIGHAELLLREVSTSEQRLHVDSIIRAAQDGAASVARVREINRTTPPQEVVAVELAELVKEAVETTAPRWRDHAEREGRTIVVSLNAEPGIWVQGAPSELREAFTNLILNAVDALPEGGSIRVDVAEREDDAVVCVEDTGTGMPEDVVQRAFDPFFTTKPFAAGTGLGLAITQGIVRRHHGMIAIRSDIGVGTTVEIALPRVSRTTPIAVLAAPPIVGGLHVLVVDDNPDLGDQLRRILSFDGHEVVVCSESAEAIARLEGTAFDVVITDLGMPGLTGWDVAKETKRRQPETKVVLVTGWASELPDGENLRARGVDILIPKPYRIETLQAALAGVQKTDRSRD